MGVAYVSLSVKTYARWRIGGSGNIHPSFHLSFLPFLFAKSLPVREKESH